MKKAIAKVFFTIMWLTITYAVARGAIQTEDILFKGSPLKLQDIVIPRNSVDRSSVPQVYRWYRNHRDAQIIDLQPIIKGDELHGWKVVWESKKDPYGVLAAYVEMESAFILPDDVSPDTVLNSMWKDVSVGFPNGNKSKPIALNMVTRDGATTVYGLWFMTQLPASKLVQRPDGSVSISVSEKDTQAHKYFVHLGTAGRAPLPAGIASLERKQPPRTPLGMDPDVVQMAPFKVAALSQWLEIRPTMNKNGTIHEMKIEWVVPNSPVAEAGVKSGVILKSIQGIQIAGLTDQQLTDKLSATPLERELRFVIIEVGLFGVRTEKMFLIPLKPTTPGAVASVN